MMILDSYFLGHPVGYTHYCTLCVKNSKLCRFFELFNMRSHGNETFCALKVRKKYFARNSVESI